MTDQELIEIIEAGGDPFPEWPNCATADCENKSCTWSALPDICFPCGERRLGRESMIRRFNETHDKPWEQSLCPPEPHP